MGFVKRNLAPGVGIEPTTNRLTGDRSTAELPRNIFIRGSSAETVGHKYFSAEKFRDPGSAPSCLRP